VSTGAVLRCGRPGTDSSFAAEILLFVPVSAQEDKTPRFRDNRHMKVVSPTDRPSLPQENIPGTNFSWRLSPTKRHIM